jgi:glycerol-3-phosphate dehydrogenase
MNFQTEVLIIGGGATGVGIARDLALRGVPSLLIERGDFASGASGGNHGLLHSGGRYAVSDPAAAKECITESTILKRIAPCCVEETDGLFLSLPEDGLEYRDRFLQSCEKAGIETHLLSKEEALELEPDLHPELISAVKVPDGAVDPFSLISSNAEDAEAHGSRFLLHTEITSFILERNRIREVRARDLVEGEEHSVHPSYVVNATGAWANHILKLAGLKIGLALSKGSLLVTNRRMSQRVINRCRPASDGDIIVPNDTVSILGTTSIRVEQNERLEATPEEVSLLIREASKMIPVIRNTRFIRAYAGVRPLYQPEEKDGDRAISRGFALIDHGKRDGLENLITITGGKLITFRVMAERVADFICKKMGVHVACSTHLAPLPDTGEFPGFKTRIGKVAAPVSTQEGEVLCDCELVTRSEVEESMKRWKMKNYQDILHRTRLAKGTCQGGFCIYRLLGVLHELNEMKGDSHR